MRLLHSSDLHLTDGGRHRLLAELARPDYDVWLDTGDFLPNAGRKKYGFIEPSNERHYQSRIVRYSRLGARILDALHGRPVIVVPGNHDFVTLGDILSLENATELHDLTRGPATVGGLRFAGFREVLRLDPRLPVPEWMGEREPAAFLPLLWSLKADPPDVLATHSPPGGMLDRVHGVGHPGVPRLLETLSGIPQEIRPRWHFFGHVHETAGRKVKRRGTIFVNGACGIELHEIG